MSHRLYVSLLFIVVVAAPARAQIPVIDVANLIEATLIAERAQRHYEELQAQYRTIQRMARPLGDLGRLKIPPVALTQHDPSRWLYGQPWIQGLNSGDPTGAAYWATTLALQPPATSVPGLVGNARQAMERQYATIEITDSVAMLAGHQVGAVRGDHAQLQTAVQALESDVLSGLDGYHDTTAILDKIAAGELLGRRQDMTTNQLLSHALEQLLARGKRLRDTEASTLNMQLITWRDGQAANDALVYGVGDALRAWRQP